MSKVYTSVGLFLQTVLRAGSLAAVAFFVFTAAAQNASATSFSVTNTNDSGAGSLRQAISDANLAPSDDTINFSLSGCPCTITLTSGELTIGLTRDAFPIGAVDSLAITGLGARQLTISGNHQSRVFYVESYANAAISDMTITAGSTPYLGGGISTNYGGLDLMLSNLTISGNTAGIGGGGIHSESGARVTLNNSTVSGNTTGDRGGGICVTGGATTLNNSTVSGNSASRGGGIYSEAQLHMYSSTVSGNSAAMGGGIFFEPGQNVFTLDNSIVANSASGSDCVKTDFFRTTISYSLIEDGGCGITNGVNNNLTGDPLLGPLQDNGGPTQTHALLAGSIAIDAGNSTFPTDQRGFARPSEVPNYPNAANGSDIGAFELQYVVPTAKAQCRNGGWKNFTFPRTFKSEGDCIQYFNTGK